MKKMLVGLLFVLPFYQARAEEIEIQINAIEFAFACHDNMSICQSPNIGTTLKEQNYCRQMIKKFDPHSRFTFTLDAQSGLKLGVKDNSLRVELAVLQNNPTLTLATKRLNRNIMIGDLSKNEFITFASVSEDDAKTIQKNCAFFGLPSMVHRLQPAENARFFADQKKSDRCMPYHSGSSTPSAYYYTTLYRLRVETPESSESTIKILSDKQKYFATYAECEKDRKK